MASGNPKPKSTRAVRSRRCKEQVGGEEVSKEVKGGEDGGSEHVGKGGVQADEVGKEHVGSEVVAKAPVEVTDGASN